MPLYSLLFRTSPLHMFYHPPSQLLLFDLTSRSSGSSPSSQLRSCTTITTISRTVTALEDWFTPSLPRMNPRSPAGHTDAQARLESSAQKEMLHSKVWRTPNPASTVSGFLEAACGLSRPLHECSRSAASSVSQPEASGFLQDVVKSVEWSLYRRLIQMCTAMCSKLFSSSFQSREIPLSVQHERM